jgi:hypothetical protein
MSAEPGSGDGARSLPLRQLSGSSLRDILGADDRADFVVAVSSHLRPGVAASLTNFDVETALEDSMSFAATVGNPFSGKGAWCFYSEPYARHLLYGLCVGDVDGRIRTSCSQPKWLRTDALSKVQVAPLTISAGMSLDAISRQLMLDPAIADAGTCDKSSAWHDYAALYEAFVAMSLGRERPLRLLEVGIASGSSLFAWAAWLPRGSRVFGVDVSVWQFELLLPLLASAAARHATCDQLRPRRRDQP